MGQAHILSPLSLPLSPCRVCSPLSHDWWRWLHRRRRRGVARATATVAASSCEGHGCCVELPGPRRLRRWHRRGAARRRWWRGEVLITLLLSMSSKKRRAKC
uniref:Uncharacterized protein n=1 Tax=Oryza rufipogon TaxID=4529 RepID=A0A0E0Q4C6_ORYRU